jgi:phage gpG-like protein
MSGLKITHLFFDSPKVIRSVDKSTRRVLSRFGAFVRRTAKQSIRKRKKASTPGSPPSSHTGLLKRFIFFGFDTQKRSVVIGPTRLTENNRGQAPSILEYGGRTTVEGNKKKTRVRISARPFMGPAFEKEKPLLPALWKDSVK